MFVVDTNVFIYAANADCDEHPLCRALVDEWRAGSLPWHATWPIVYEFLRVVTHQAILPQPWSAPEAWKFVESVASSPGFSFLIQTERHADIAKQALIEHSDLSGNILHDTHTAILMREHGIRRIYTRDADFHRFPFLEVVNPLQKKPPGKRRNTRSDA